MLRNSAQPVAPKSSAASAAGSQASSNLSPLNGVTAQLISAAMPSVALMRPTSATIAPGPSAVLPRPSFSAPTRIEILPRCWLSRISWCASATPSKPSVFQSTGRICPFSISSLALLHSHALAKCEPMICFCFIHR